jgi:hypothetical protein
MSFEENIQDDHSMCQGCPLLEDCPVCVEYGDSACVVQIKKWQEVNRDS